MRFDRLADGEGVVRAGDQRQRRVQHAPGYPTSLEPQDCKSSPPTKAQANAAGKNYAAAAGCGTGNGAAVAACLRALPAATVETLAGGGAGHPGGYPNGGQGTVGPTINGTTLKMSVRQALATGHVNKVRVIIGTDRDEDLVAYLNEASFPVTTPAAYQTIVDAQYGSHASSVLAKYPLTDFDSPKWRGGRSRRTPTRSARRW